jgi:hypothetical protein
MLGFFQLPSHDNVNLDMSGVIDEFARRHHKESYILANIILSE